MYVKDKLIATIYVICIVVVCNMFVCKDSISKNSKLNNEIKEEVNISKEEDVKELIVYVTPTGKRYHLKKSCAGKNAITTTLDEQKNETTPCKKCSL